MHRFGRDEIAKTLGMVVDAAQDYLANPALAEREQDRSELRRHRRVEDQAQRREEHVEPFDFLPAGRAAEGGIDERDFDRPFANRLERVIPRGRAHHDEARRDRTA